MKVLIFIVIGILIVCMFSIVFYYTYIKEDNKLNTKFYGPVPEGYDLEHFRRTGETKIMEVKE